MNFFALVVALLVGLLSDWGDAAWWVFGYLFAWLIVGAGGKH